MIDMCSDMGKALIEAIGQLLREGNRLVGLGPRATEQELAESARQKGKVLEGFVIEPLQDVRPSGAIEREPGDAPWAVTSYVGFDGRRGEP